MKTIYLRGAIVGPNWYGQQCMMELNQKLERHSGYQDGPIQPEIRRSLFEMVADTLNTGDFKRPRLSADSWFEIVSETQNGNRRRIYNRTFEATEFPSIAELVDMEVYGSDFYED